eukprot:m51a1_g1203 hypothetical protein (323) ;mRNA; r:456954-458326
MKLALLVVLLAVAATATPLDTFRNWARAHGKVYTATQELRRFYVWKQNLAKIDELNEQGHALFGSSPHADLTVEEFRNLYLRPMQAPRGMLRSEGIRGDAPDSFDWRAQTPARVAPVQNQGSCGSCWAFSTVVVLENIWAREHALVKLSEQQLVDCDHDCQDPADKDSCDSGCNGGLPITALNYTITWGIESSKDYPYTGRDGKCAYSESKVAATYKGAVALLARDEEAIKQEVYKGGPVSVGVYADPWQFYFGGIYDHSTCSSDESKMDHGVAIVGYGTESGKDFWIVRNSWGASWGEKGYIRVARGKNMCGIANMVTTIH